MVPWVCWGHPGACETLAKIQGSASHPSGAAWGKGCRVLRGSCRHWQLVGVPLYLSGPQGWGDPPAAGLSPNGCMSGMSHSITLCPHPVRLTPCPCSTSQTSRQQVLHSQPGAQEDVGCRRELYAWL